MSFIDVINIRKRNKFYRKLLKAVCEDPSTDFGICYYALKLGEPLYPATYYFKESFPELYELKPKKNFDRHYWFARTSKGWEKRIALIEKAIEMTS